MEIEKLGMGFTMVKEGSIPSHPIIIISKGLWGKWYGKASFFKWIFPLLSAQDIADNAFGKKNESRVNFVEGVGYVN